MAGRVIITHKKRASLMSRQGKRIEGGRCTVQVVGSWSTPSCFRILLIMCLYGLNLNVTNMSGDIFVNFTLMASTNLTNVLLILFLIEKVGRRVFLLTVALLGGLACLSTIVPTVLGSNGKPLCVECCCPHCCGAMAVNIWLCSL